MFSYQRCENVAQAIGQAATIVSLSKFHSEQPFTQVLERLAAPVMLNQYLFQIYEEELVGFVSYGLLSNLHQHIITSGIRNLSPVEYKTGDNFVIVDAVAPLGNKDELIKQLKKDIENARSNFGSS